MKLTSNDNEKRILIELGKRIKYHRISMDVTQTELAERCGVSISTEIRIENGEDGKLSNYIKILTELGFVENFELLIPDEKPDYKALFEEKTMRKRVSRTRKKSETTWVWGEDKGE